MLKVNYALLSGIFTTLQGSLPVSSMHQQGTNDMLRRRLRMQELVQELLLRQHSSALPAPCHGQLPSPSSHFAQVHLTRSLAPPLHQRLAWHRLPWQPHEALPGVLV